MSKPICCPRCREKVRRWLGRAWKRTVFSHTLAIYAVDRLCGSAPRPKAKAKKKGKKR